MKLNKKHLAVAVIVVVAVVILVTWLISQTEYPIMTPELQNCVEEKRSKMYGTVDGQITVRFNGGVPESDAKKLVESYGMAVLNSDHMNFDNSYFLRAGVPKGKEFEWMCEFERNGIVNYTLNVVVMGPL